MSLLQRRAGSGGRGWQVGQNTAVTRGSRHPRLFCPSQLLSFSRRVYVKAQNSLHVKINWKDLKIPDTQAACQTREIEISGQDAGSSIS